MVWSEYVNIVPFLSSENDPRFTCERKVSTILCVHSDHSTRSEDNDKSDCDFKNVSNISEHCQSRTIDSNNIKEEVQRDSDNQWIKKKKKTSLTKSWGKTHVML